jgi:hypothetical protein
MHPLKEPSRANFIQKIFLFGLFLSTILVIVGWILVPATSLLSIAGIGCILVVYGLVGYFVFPRIPPAILRLVAVLGLLAGIIFVGEILLEYALLPADNTSWGLIEIGAVFAIYFLAGVWAAYQSRNIKQGTLAAILSAMFSSVIWLIVVLVTL